MVGEPKWPGARRGHAHRRRGAGWAAAVLAAITPSAAHAYLDPGNAYLALQALVGMIAAFGATLALYRDRVRAWLRLPPREQAKAESTNPEEEEAERVER